MLAAKPGRRLFPSSFYQESPAFEVRVSNEDVNKIHNTFLAHMYFLWLPSWALAVVPLSKHPPIKCTYTKLLPWITENLDIFSQDSNSISPLSHLHATTTTEKVIAQWHEMDQENYMIAELDKPTENKGSFPRVTFVSGLKIRELGEVMDKSHTWEGAEETHAMTQSECQASAGVPEVLLYQHGKTQPCQSLSPRSMQLFPYSASQPFSVLSSES